MKSLLMKLFHPMLIGILLMLSVYLAFLLNAFHIKDVTKTFSLDTLTKLYPFEDLYPETSELFAFVDIDENSLKALGQWPWPRNLTASLVEKTLESGASAIAVDILFAEPDRFSQENLEEYLGKKIRSKILDGDALLGTLGKSSPIVFSFAVSEIKDASNAIEIGNRFVTIGNVSQFLPRPGGLITPTKKLGQAQGYGFINTQVEGGLIRETPLILTAQGHLTPALGLDTLRVAQGASNHIIKMTEDQAGLAIKTGEVTSTVDLYGKLVFHMGHMTRYQRVSALDVLQGKVKLDDKIVVIGASAKGLGDTHATVLEDVVPGPLFHLQVMEQIIAQRFLLTHPVIEQAAHWISLLVGSLLCFIIARMSMAVSAGLLIVILVMLGMSSVYGFVEQGLVINFPASAAIILSGFLGTYFSQTLLEALLKKGILKRLESNELVTEVMQQYAESGDIYHSLTQLIPQVLNLIKADSVLYFEFNAKHQYFQCAFTHGEEKIKGTTLPTDTPWLQEVFTDKKTLLATAKNRPDAIESMQTKFSLEFESVCIVPVTFGEEVFGCLLAIRKIQGKKVRPFEDDQIALFESLASNLGIAIKNVMLGSKVVLDKLLEKDLKDAEQAQTMMFPDPKRFLEISGGVLPYRMLSGDFVDYFMVGNRIAFIEGDVSGKGVPAAIMMARCSSLFKIFSQQELEPHEIAKSMNRLLSETDNDSRFVSLVLGWFDPRDRALSLVNCGHNPVIHLAGSQLKTFGITAPPIGTVGPSDFMPTTVTIQLNQGESIYIATDGITESKVNGEELGVKGFAKVAYQQQNKSAYERYQGIRKLLLSGRLGLHDDATILIISV